jgi:YHYH protein
MRVKLYSTMLIVILILTACATPPPQSPADSNPASSNPTVVPALPTSIPAATESSPSDALHVDVLDVTHLTLGDNKTSTTPQRGYVYSCITQFNGGGAQGTGSWINSDGTWDLTKKVYVDGSVSWPHSFTITTQGDQRIFSSNDLPDHPTGSFPISPNDDAYQIDRNPNSIKTQSIQFSIPANPTVAAQPTCVGGEIGIMLSGVLIFSAFDAEGRDAVAHEVQDQCDGHPQEGGFYHYHSLSPCISDSSNGPSKLMGYAFDGFGIYGPYGADGKELTNADLDECHGITSDVEWDGQMVTMYHYVATREFPYVVGCFRGTPSVTALTSPNGAGGSQQPGGGQNQQNGNGGQPPQEALNACINLPQGAACTINTPNGQVNGTCNFPPNSSQLACTPAGGHP